MSLRNGIHLSEMEDEVLRLMYQALDATGTRLLMELRRKFPDATREDVERITERFEGLGWLTISRK